MYHSFLLIEVGDNPDRPRPGRLWLRNPYHIHQRLCMAFPTLDRKQTDQQFLKSYAPTDFAVRQVHVDRAENAGFLFRVDTRPGQPPVIVLQSAAKPDWDYAFHNAPELLAAPAQVREYQPNFHTGQRVRFRIHVNLSQKLKQAADGADLRKYNEKSDRQGRPKSQSKRVSLIWADGQSPQEVVRDWFARKVHSALTLEDFQLLRMGWVRAWKPKEQNAALVEETGGAASATGRRQHPMQFRAALLEGAARIEDPTAAVEKTMTGIGAAKGLGFGLLSLWPVAPATEAGP